MYCSHHVWCVNLSNALHTKLLRNCRFLRFASREYISCDHHVDVTAFSCSARRISNKANTQNLVCISILLFGALFKCLSLRDNSLCK